MDRQSLETAILELDMLLADENSSEAVFQKWFERHVLVLEILGFTKVLPHPRLMDVQDTKYIPDFMGQRVDALWQIVEIKTPATSVLKNPSRRSTFYAEMEKYISQCQEYSSYFDDAANRDAFFSKYRENVQKHPTSILIAGRSVGLDPGKVHEMLSRRMPIVVHQTYDDIRASLEFQRARLYAPYENLQGVTIQLVMELVRPPTPRPTHVLDLGETADRNRISVRILESGALELVVLDSNGVPHQTAIPQAETTFQFGKTFYVSLEAGMGSNYSTIVIETNANYCAEARLSGFSFELNPKPAIVLGSDLLGEAESWMQVASVALYSRTLSFEERIGTRSYYYHKYWDSLSAQLMPTKTLKYCGHKFMHSKGHPLFDATGGPRTGDLVQPVDHKRPTLNVRNEK